MTHVDVYNIAKALSREEQIKLYNTLHKSINSNKTVLKQKKQTLKYNQKDALSHLLKTLF